MISMLLRLVEPTGHVYIDNVDTLGIGLHDLRKHISIIPQVNSLVKFSPVNILFKCIFMPPDIKKTCTARAAL